MGEQGQARPARPAETLDHFLDLSTFSGIVTHGRNLDQQWQVTDQAATRSAVAEFAAVLDGLVADWIEERSTVAGVLAHQLAAPITSPFSARGCAVLALQSGQPELAAALVAKVAPGLTAEKLHRLSVFQATLQDHFPDFRPVDLPVR